MYARTHYTRARL